MPQPENLAYTVYEAALHRPDDDPYSRLQINGPAAKLISLYDRDHRREDIRRLLLKFSKTDESMSQNIGYPVDYLKQMKIQGLASAADKLLELGFAADAVLLYNQAIGLSAELAPDSPRYFVSGDGSVGFFNVGLTRALDAVTPDELAAGLSRLIKSEESPAGAGGATKPAKPPESGAFAGSSKPKKDEPFLDMMVLAHPRDLAKARVRSLFAEAVTAAPAKQRAGEKGDDQLAAALEEARKKHPDDLGLAICEALRAMAGNDPARKAPAVARLLGLVEKTPLEALGAGERAMRGRGRWRRGRFRSGWWRGPAGA